MWFQYSQNWIIPVGLGLLRTAEGWTRWPPGLFQPKITLWFKLSFNVFDKTVLSSWLELVSDLLLVHTVSLLALGTPALRLSEFIRKSCRKSFLIPSLFYVFLLWHTLKLNYRMPSEHAWNVCEYCGFWFQFNSKAKCKCTWISRGHLCSQYPPNPARCMLQLPGVLM